jgi:cyanate lyase
LLAAKKAKDLTFADLESVVGCDKVWIASLFYRQIATARTIEGIFTIAGHRPESVTELGELKR